MSDHGRYEELAALEAGGHLSEQESAELSAHLASCAVCRQEIGNLRFLLRSGLPLATGDSLGFWNRVRDRVPSGARQRFLTRAEREGARFSFDVHEKVLTPQWRIGSRVAVAAALAAAIGIAVFLEPAVLRRIDAARLAQQQASRLALANSALTTQLSDREREIARQRQELDVLRGQLSHARDAASRDARLEQPAGKPAPLLDQLENRDRQLAASSEEINRINQLRVRDAASLEAERLHMRELSDQLRVAEATLDVERQLVADGRDLRELLAARQLRVVDVRDTDAAGKPGQAFGRVFLTENKALIFFAFDLVDDQRALASARFQVWGEQSGKAGSIRNLGVLSLDDRSRNRWTLKVDNPGAVSEINSVFVTASGADRGGNGQRQLYAYLGTQ